MKGDKVIAIIKEYVEYKERQRYGEWMLVNGNHLPDSKEIVIGRVINHNLGVTFSHPVVLKDGTWIDVDLDKEINGEVTHWMHLPSTDL